MATIMDIRNAIYLCFVQFVMFARNMRLLVTCKTPNAHWGLLTCKTPDAHWELMTQKTPNVKGKCKIESEEEEEEEEEQQKKQKCISINLIKEELQTQPHHEPMVC